MDEPLAKHFAHLYIRDPLTLFSEKIILNDKEDSDHFEVSAVLLKIFYRYNFCDVIYRANEDSN